MSELSLIKTRLPGTRQPGDIVTNLACRRVNSNRLRPRQESKGYFCFILSVENSTDADWAKSKIAHQDSCHCLTAQGIPREFHLCVKGNRFCDIPDGQISADGQGDLLAIRVCRWKTFNTLRGKGHNGIARRFDKTVAQGVVTSRAVRLKLADIRGDNPQSAVARRGRIDVNFSRHLR